MANDEINFTFKGITEIQSTDSTEIRLLKKNIKDRAGAENMTLLDSIVYLTAYAAKMQYVEKVNEDFRNELDNALGG